MATELAERAPRSRCYECGSADNIVSLCHHCGRPLCELHAPKVLDENKFASTKEFAGLDLDRIGVWHCAEHAHNVRGSLTKLKIAGIAAGVLGLALSFVSVAIGLVLLIAGAATAAGAFWFEEVQRQRERDNRPPLPVTPHIDALRVTERLSGTLTLDDEGDYRSSPQPAPVTGTIEVAMNLSKPDQDRLAKYREKYRLTDADPVEFCAGFAVIGGKAGIGFGADFPAGATLLPGGTAIRFGGQVADHALFSQPDSVGNWQFHAPYTLAARRKMDRIPLWLTPSIVPASDRRTLELDLQWVDFGEDREPLTIERIDLIQLQVPASWGNVESATPRALTGNSPDPADSDADSTADAVWQPTRTIEWRRLTEGVRKHGVTLTIRFEKAVKPDEEDKKGAGKAEADRLRGQLQIYFKGTVSGIEDVAFYHPLGGRQKNLFGGRRDDKDCEVRTIASVDFDLSLSRVRYQDIWVMPEVSEQIVSDELPGVIPDHHTVIDVTNSISGRYYVKRVIENPPRGGKRSEVTGRSWDIAGRHYHGVYPIDFHITLTGQELYPGDIQAHTGNTVAQVTAQGAYANAAMRQAIEKEWKQLHARVVDELTARSKTPAEPPEPLGPAETLVTSPPKQDHDLSASTVANGHGSSRAAQRKERKEAITQALLQGRISEQTFAVLMAQLDEDFPRES